MLEKDRFSKKSKVIIVSFILFFSPSLLAKNINEELINYNFNLKNSSASFIQSNGKSVGEGVIYFGLKRIKIDYLKPNKLTLIFSEKKGAYINHELEEAEYFRTSNSYLLPLLSLFNNKIPKTAKVLETNDFIEVIEEIIINEMIYNIKIVYENNPIKIRKIEILSNDEKIEFGLFNHKIREAFRENFFSMINPYQN